MINTDNENIVRFLSNVQENEAIEWSTDLWWLEVYSGKKSLWSKFINMFSKKENSNKYTTEEFFSVIKKGKSKLTKDKANKYREKILEEISQAKLLWQNKILEKLESQALWIQKEIQILNELWLDTYVFEADLADLESVGIKDKTIYRKVIENYEGIIPKDCVEKISKAKEAKLFDDLVIIYTRNKDRAMNLDKTKKTNRNYDETKKVDPICFGRVNSTWRLFFICDWMDDECDLTLSKLQKEIDVHKIV